MCGIVGFFDRAGASRTIGRTVLDMLTALACRGPDSAGIAVYGEPGDGLVVRAKTGERAVSAAVKRQIASVARNFGRVHGLTTQGSGIRLVVNTARADELGAALEATAPGVEVVSMGRRLEIAKQVGGPENLESEFRISRLEGTHALGHTRLSTESRVDLSHSQPFWAHGTPDLAVVHNGHITNYHRLRRQYEQEGARFYTDNDSEVIGVYLARKMREGLTFRQALEASVRDLDGSFSYIAATADTLGYAKDPYCLKPLIVAEADQAIALANEEVALRAALGEKYRAREAGAGEVGTWEIKHVSGTRRTRTRGRERVA